MVAAARGLSPQLPQGNQARLSVFSLVVTSGPRLGDVESGVVASLAGARVSVLSGGLACVAAAALVTAAFPALARYHKDTAIAGQRRLAPAGP